MIDRLLKPARWLTFILGVIFSLMAIYSFAYTAQMVFGDPALVLPNEDLWTTAQLATTLAGLGLPGNFYALYTLGVTLLFGLSFLVCGWLILLRRSQDWFGMYLALLLLSWANGVGVFSSMPNSPVVERTSYLGWFMWPGLFLLLYFFPSGHIVPRWARWFAWGWILFAIYNFLTDILGVLSDNFLVFLPIIISVLLVGGYAQIYRYRHAAGLERQQIKVVVVSLVTLAGSFILISLTENFTSIGDPRQSGPTAALVYQLFSFTIGSLVFMGVPVSIAVAVLRYRLWDVDIIIRKTLVYGAVTATLGMVFFGSVILLQSLVAAVGGQQSAVITVVSTLLIAALFTPLRRRVQNDIDRRFYRKKYNAEKTIAAFSSGLREQIDLEDLQGRLVSVVEETLQPELISLTIFKKK
jgi:hypothetical protein